ncbi:MAG: hypothetical protein ACREBD_28955 [Blastocatellia bacterium]
MNDIEAKQIARRERYLRDPLPVRLGNLASNLARIGSFSNHPTMGEAAGKALDESLFFIEWTAADASLPQQAELIELRQLLARWRPEWAEIWNDPGRRSETAAQAGVWSQRILESSGLLNPQGV